MHRKKMFPWIMELLSDYINKLQVFLAITVLYVFFIMALNKYFFNAYSLKYEYLTFSVFEAIWHCFWNNVGCTQLPVYQVGILELMLYDTTVLHIHHDVYDTKLLDSRFLLQKKDVYLYLWQCLFIHNHPPHWQSTLIKVLRKKKKTINMG